MKGNQSGAIRISTGNGYVDIGSQNTTACQINTDRAGFSFNKGITFNGSLTATSTFNLYQTGQPYQTIQVVASTGKKHPCGTEGIGQYCNLRFGADARYVLLFDDSRWESDRDRENGADRLVLI